MNNFLLGLPGETWTMIIIIIGIVVINIITVKKEIKKEEEVK
ncbi:hypothetical protein [Sporanaerobacter acetigenes]|nr:hypothetical protein [Sporanaerobacter acetigenes]